VAGGKPCATPLQKAFSCVVKKSPACVSASGNEPVKFVMEKL